ncbi:MAG: thiamine pyrophosphate-binding protein [Candidatus Bathyarchaeota archaeon]|nr:thiamine pyrophosphate-binding protein [Candidatus Bathyarchaeota archaeon]
MVKAVNGLVNILEAEGIKRVCTFPTSHINNAVGEEGAPELFMVRDERYAVSVADAIGRVSNGKQIGVCTVMGGVNAAGTQMAYGAMAEAYEDSVPLLCLTDGVPPSVLGRERYSIQEGFRSVTKWIGYINSAERVPEYMRRAFTELRTGRPSPVLLEVPRELKEYDPTEYPYVPVKGWRSMGDPKDIEKAVKALKKAEKPLLWVGQGVFSADAVDELKRFAEMAHLPVLTTLKGKSLFPENHELSLGVRGEPAERFLKRADLVLTIGVGYTACGFMHTIPDALHKKIIQVTNDPHDLNRDYAVDHAILGDAKLVLNQLISELEKQGAPKKDDGLIKMIDDAKRVKREKYSPLMESSEKPINPYRVYAEIMNVIDMQKSLVTHESGNTRDQLSTVYESRIPHGFLGWGNVTTLGYGLAGAMGAKLVYPDWEVVSVTGDAGVGYQMGNWEAMVRNKLGITTLHINNDGFGGYGPGFWGKGHSPYTYELTPSTTQSTAKVAEALGFDGERVDDSDEVAGALRRGLEKNKAGKPYLVEVICSKYPVYPGWVRS